MSNENPEQDFHLRELLDKYLIHLKWFILSVFITVICAFLYLRYATPQYKAATTILVKDEKKGGMLSELSAFSDLGIGGGMGNNIDNEIEILKSRTLVESTVEKLSLNISLISKGNVKDGEIYDNKPISITLANQKTESFTHPIVFEYKELSAGSFLLKTSKNSEGNDDVLKGKSQFKYNEVIKTEVGNLIINKTNTETKSVNDAKIFIEISPLENVAESFKSRLSVAPLSKTSSVVELSLVDPVKEKAEDFLNMLVQTYNQNAVIDKNIISENTSKFIAGRLALITEELDGVERDVESFKRENNLTDIESEAKLFIEGSSEYNKKAVETEIQLNVVASMLDFIKKSSNSDLLPTNIVTQGDASGLINSYNTLILERNRVLKSATDTNPAVVKLDQQISSLKASVAASLNRLQSSLNIEKRNLNSSEGIINAKISKIPVQERQFRVIARQQKVKEELYLYLLQKREETAISLAATEDNARVIDTAKALKAPVSPKKNIVYLAALLLGLLIPFGIIYLIDLLDNKIKSRKDIEGKTQIPFVGDVPKSDSPNEIIRMDSRSSSAEAIRIIRTNLEFMLGKVPDGVAKTIFMTSTFPKEGKTFVSVNLAATFALSGKKVLLIGLDIRNPRLDDYLTLPQKGVTNYLSSKDVVLEDLVVKQEGFEEFYVLPAGAIPPNPAELLMSKRVDDLFTTFKSKFDYIIVDTAPVSLVTDTLLIAKHADCTVYVARANYLEKRMLHIPDTLYREHKLTNMGILLNDTSTVKGYGYGYGYGYGVEVNKEPWYKTIFKK